MNIGRSHWCLFVLMSWATLGIVERSSAEVKLIVPASYLRGVPFLTRVEVRDGTGARDWSLWDAQATLAVDQPGVTLSTNRMMLRNGLGTALITIDGNEGFNLTATVNGENAARAISNFSSQPVTSVGGPLPGATTTWSGVVNVNGTVTVPVGHTLTIQPNTLVRINGVSAGTSGIGIIVNGSIQSLGTELQPVTITSSNSNQNWGQIRHDDAQPSIYRYTFISKAGRAPGEGHTGTSPAIRPSNSTISFESSVISDLTSDGVTIGKIMMANGSTLTFSDSVLARARMGPEIAGTGLVFTNSYIMEMNGPDDADGIYLHSSAGRSLTLSGSVIAGGDDDAVDTLDSNVTIENCILRDWPNPNEDAKGISAFNGEVILRRSLIANCFSGVSAKSGGPLAVFTIDQCTITGITDRGVSAATKANAAAGNINIYMTHTIVRAPDAMYSDFGPEKFVSVKYCALSESWPGEGNITSDPLFKNAAAGDFHLQEGSPCIDAGDPATPLDPDGSRADIGVYVAKSQPSPLSVNITRPGSGALYLAPATIAIDATATAAAGNVTRVEFFEGSRKLGEDSSSPFSFSWTNVAVGNYTLRAVATQSGGIVATSVPISIAVMSAQVPSTNMVFAAGSEWTYLDNGSDQGTAWRELKFADISWKTGKAQLGYGDGDEATVVSFGPSANSRYTTTYFRRTFSLTDVASVTQLTVRLLRDDGGVVYLNGTEVFRSNMPAGAITPATFASGNATTADETTMFYSQNIDPRLLVEGQNVIAVEIHQVNLTSSDVSFDLDLTAVSMPTNARPIVAITNPVGGAAFGAPASFTISANAFDPDGTVANVAFYSNNVKLSDDTTSPFSFSWNSVPAGNYSLVAVASDAAGLSATSSVVNVTVSANVARPAVVSQSPSPGPVSNLTQITVNFSKAVRGVDASDLLINSIPATQVAGSDNRYTFTFQPPTPGTVTVRWVPSHGITDTFTPPNAFNSSDAAATWQYEWVDTVGPSVERLSPLAGSTTANLTNIVVTFSESITGLKASDLLINSRPATGLSGTGAGPYTFTFKQPAQGTVALSWAPSNGIRDQSNNPFTGELWTYLLDSSNSDVVISEIMYHPSSENPLEEFIELFNRGAAPVNLQGWSLRGAVKFSFPSVSIPAGGFLVAAADLTVFRNKYPGVNNAVGNWTGMLSNNREDIHLDDPESKRVDSVHYADEGDWAIRRRGPLDRNHRGWEWFAEHDGLGKSLELINPKISNNSGQNWASSQVAQGTPGKANSVLKTETAPLIQNVGHFPIVPRSSEAILVTAQVTDESADGVTVLLSYRVDAATPPPFKTLPMRDDGQNGDASARDGIFTATLPTQVNNAVVEFYVTAGDALGNTRTWPAPAIAAADGGGPIGQVVNALLQVDDTAYTGIQPLYKIIMTESERAELQVIPSQSSSEGPNSQMNATFISIDGTGTELRYLTGVRNRGHGSRTANPPNYHVAFRRDGLWKGGAEINFNTVQVPIQHFGSWLANKSGAMGDYSHAAQVRINNVNRANPGGGMFGSYAANEAYGPEWAQRRIPFDSQGNMYRVVRDIRPPNFDYRGPNKNAYVNTYFKETNASEDDWTDLIGMLQIMGENSDALFTVENIRKVINLDQWLTHFAVMNLFANGESGLNSGNNDDYFMYRGVADRRFILLYHDLDSILGTSSLASNTDIFRATCCPISGDSEGSWRAIARLLHHPEIEPLYYATLQGLLATTFSKPQFDALIDQALSSYVPQGTINSAKTWMDQRRAFVQSRLPAVIAAKAPVALITGAPRSPTPGTTAALGVGGAGVTHYRASLNGGPFETETPVETPISLSGLSIGTNTVAVIGRNALGTFQAATEATVASWVVNTSWPGVRLNEVMASRSGNLPDQIELYNEGASPVNLAGMRLTDELNNTNKFTFGSTTLAPGAYLVLDSAQLGFSLSETGEAVYLLDSAATGGTLLDSVEFGPQLPDLSIGRSGGSGDWFLSQPSFGAANTAQPMGKLAQVKINEWLTVGVSPYPDDFVELYNPQLLPVALGGSYLTDQPISTPTRSRIMPLTFMAAGGYAMFHSGNGQRANEINFNLSAEQGEIALLAPDRSAIDSVIYGPQRIGISSGRCPDGDAVQRALVSPTPGGPNQCSSTTQVSVVINEVLTNNTTLAEADGSKPDWIELYNPAASAVDLSGMSLTDDVTNPRRWIVPNGVLLPARGFFKLRLDSSAPASDSNAGFGLSENGGAVFLFNTQAAGGGLQNAVTYGLQAADWSIGRIPDGGTNWVLNIPTPGLANRSATLGNAQALKINEWMADAASGDDWFEIFNPNAEPVEISRLWLSDSLNDRMKSSVPPLSFIGRGSHGFLKFTADQNLNAGADHANFKLSGSGESLAISTSNGTLIDGVSFGPQLIGVSQGRLPDGSANTVSFPASPTPGSSNFLPLSNVVINELLSHSDPPLEDAVELFNTSAAAVDIGGWFLSDSELNLRKYQIPANTILRPGGYLVLYEYQFNSATAAEPFSFNSARGDATYLSQANNGVLTGYRAFATFGPAENGVSFGRISTSQGFHFVPMAQRTFGKDSPATTNEFTLGAGAPNGSAKVGPIVISELMYHPAATNDALEFIELHNVGALATPLYDTVNPSNTWRLRKGIDFDFPPGTSIPSGGYLVVVSFNPQADLTALAAFRSAYGTNAILAGPYKGKLKDSGDSIELQKPDAPQTLPGPDFGFVPYITADRIDYDDDPPWPISADGNGDSLQKINHFLYGNDPANWTGATPNPGTAPASSGDSDNDGIPNDWEIANGLNPNDPADAAADADGDGLSNLQEFLAGTNPRSVASVFKAEVRVNSSGVIVLEFGAAAKKSYTVEFRDSLVGGTWQKLAEISATTSDRGVQLPITANGIARFFRIVLSQP